MLAASLGWNLGIRVIPNAEDVTPNSELPDSTLESMFAFDVVLANWDRTAMSRNLLRDDSDNLWWIDHGSCRFLHNLANRLQPTLPTTHFLFDAQNQIEPRPLPMLTSSAVNILLAELPDEWLEATGHVHARLASDLLDYLHRNLA
ncbi:MAG: hypothetical protein GY811_11830 [Myxococcales bacterium]|nr:hypothetical protein [Myxococcales bacterium]